MVTTNQIIAVTGVATLLATAVAILVTLKGVREELWLHTFSEYTKRYLDYARELPSAARDPEVEFSAEELAPAERHELLDAARMYINLCSEEHYLHARGKIDAETWDIWSIGMRDAFRLPWFRSVWEDLRHEYDLYPGFCSFFDECYAGASSSSASSGEPAAAGTTRRRA